MISLAQYLTEFPEESDRPFQSLKAAKPKPEKKPSFEHLTLVSDAPAKTKKKKSVPLQFEAIPEMGEAEAALDEVDFDAADFGFDADMATVDLTAAATTITEADLDAARAEGQEAGRAEALTEAEARVAVAVAEAVAAERARAEAEKAEAVNATRLEVLAEEGNQLGAMVIDKLERIEAALRTSLASVLKPIAIDARIRQTVEDLAAAVAVLSLDGRALSLQAIGPALLLDAFAEALGERRGFVAFEANETMTDIRIECDQTTLETRLADWKNALEEALQ
ncbi:hypothetical protein LQ948_01565 [Jiella sp. MQZ9-1]|uniref:Flagellar assembly protein FliH n=1 Tax=Jiella flava TaxID=2816857 RepID=A0A939JQU7_9HYPH|nr:hypothetical protein [Jiella flava]MBO0661248.1 hypothetical protein [Jiella flava]MCD2469893.1 hypothetical protein [Jiella flava]